MSKGFCWCSLGCEDCLVHVLNNPLWRSSVALVIAVVVAGGGGGSVCVYKCVCV